MKTRVVHIKKESFDVYIGRAGRGHDGYFGNPFRLEPGESRGATIDRYRAYFLKRIKKDPKFKIRIENLRGKILGCFCKPSACHGDVIVDWLEEEDAG